MKFQLILLIPLISSIFGAPGGIPSANRKPETPKIEEEASGGLGGIFHLFDGIFADTSVSSDKETKKADLPSIRHDHEKVNPLLPKPQHQHQLPSPNGPPQRPPRPNRPNLNGPHPVPMPNRPNPSPNHPNSNLPNLNPFPNGQNPNFNPNPTMPNRPNVPQRPNINLNLDPNPNPMPNRPNIPQRPNINLNLDPNPNPNMPNRPNVPQGQNINLNLDPNPTTSPRQNPPPQNPVRQPQDGVLSTSEEDSESNVPNLGQTPESSPNPSSIPNRGTVVFRPPSFFPPNRTPFIPGIPNRQLEVRPIPEPIPQKFLPSKIPEEKTPCLGVNGTRIGECVDAYSCGESGGDFVGICRDRRRVCCSFTSFCNYATNLERVYLNNPNYPKPINRMNNCGFRLSPQRDVCQVRLDFLDFHLKPPSASTGECDPENSLHIESNDPNAYIPVKMLCGTLSEDKWDPLGEDVPHLYVHFNQYDPLLTRVPPTRPKNPNLHPNMLFLNFKIKDHLSSWNVRLTQVSCAGGARLQAPSGCGRYYTGENGTISSLNYKDGLYPSNIDYTTCIRRESGPGACGITYTMNPEKHGFTVGAKTQKDILNFGMDCTGDFVSFSGEKAAFCGSVESRAEFKFRLNNGPISFHHHSDGVYNKKRDVGFRFDYNFERKCQNYFNYNVYHN